MCSCILRPPFGEAVLIGNQGHLGGAWGFPVRQAHVVQLFHASLYVGSVQVREMLRCRSSDGRTWIPKTNLLFGSVDGARTLFLFGGEVPHARL